MVKFALLQKISLMGISLLFLITQIVVFIYACFENNVLYIVTALMGIVAGALGFYAGLREVNWAAGVVIVLTIALLMLYSVIWATLDSPIKVDNNTLFLRETEFKCCGKEGPRYYTRRQQKIPKSCYPEDKEGQEEFLYHTGCDEFPQQVKSHTTNNNARFPLFKEFVIACFGIDLLLLISVCCWFIDKTHDNEF